MHRLIAAGAVLLLCTVSVLGQAAKDKDKESEKAAATRKVLEGTKISVEYQDALLQSVLEELAEKTETASKQKVQFKRDPKGAATQNQKINYVGKDKTVKTVLDELCKKNDLTWTIVSGKAKLGANYDGFVFIAK